MDVVVPENVRRTVLAWFGDDGRAWLAALPGRVERLAARWDLRLGPPYDGASHALVLAVERADGTPAVLKVSFLDEENRAEAAALRLYRGDGAVRLYDADEPTGALLLERIEPGTPLSRDPTPATARRLRARIAAGLGVDARRLGDWAFLRAMANALWQLDLPDGAPDVASSLAQAAVLAAIRDG